MADDWDLHAVVGGRAAAIPIENHVNSPQDLLPELASANLTNDHDPFYHLGIHDNKSYQFPGLEEIYRKFNSQPEPICSSFSIPALGGLIGSQQQIQMVTPPSQQHTEQQQIQPQFQISRDGSSLTLPNQPSHTVRPRKRKNQQKRLVRQMTHEELLADSWAWRKYGQKPIKGSPYPRNYYRCSSSKGCLARKQVEISPSDPNIYVVSYTGEHTHPRPTHRNSLAGSSRNKFSGARSSQNSSDHRRPSAAAVPNPSCSSSSPISSSSFSPATPLMEGAESSHHEIARCETTEIQNDDETEGNGTENNEDVLIPNTVMSEDILKGFQELRQGFSAP